MLCSNRPSAYYEDILLLYFSLLECFTAAIWMMPPFCIYVFLILIQNTVYTMDLRSAHKTPEKPAPRLRLSLTRSLVPEDEDEDGDEDEDEDEDEDDTYSDSTQDPRPHVAYRKSKPRKSPFRCLDSNPPSPTEEDWEGRGEEDEDDDEDIEEDVEEEEEEEETVAQRETTEKSVGICNGKCVSRL